MNSSLPIRSRQTKSVALKLVKRPPGRLRRPPRLDLHFHPMTSPSVTPHSPVLTKRQRERRSRGVQSTTAITSRGGQRLTLNIRSGWLVIQGGPTLHEDQGHIGRGHLHP